MSKLFVHISKPLGESSFNLKRRFIELENMAAKHGSGKYSVCMVRHGSSEWKERNRLCGWYNSRLSRNGFIEALTAGRTINDHKIIFDVAHTSMLSRAQRTLQIMLVHCNQEHVPVHKSWRLNECHYGALTGLNELSMMEKYGEEELELWRRSYDAPPPPMTKEHKYYNAIVNDERYRENGPSAAEFPMSESLKMTSDRVLPYWFDNIVPQILNGQRVLIVAHDTTLRVIIKHLDDISDVDIMKLNLPTGMPFLYELDEDLKPLVSMHFLASKQKVKVSIDQRIGDIDDAEQQHNTGNDNSVTKFDAVQD